MDLLTDKERKAIADIFRRLSRKEKLSAVELGPAVQYLVNLRWFSKDETVVKDFFDHCFSWFCDKEERFASLPDAAVILEVGNRFKTYVNDQRNAEKPTTVPCPECGGTGLIETATDCHECKVCFGIGEIAKPNQVSHPGQFPEIEDDEGNRASDDDFAITGEQPKGYNVPSTSWKDWAAKTNYERARQKAEARRWLKSWLGFLRSFSSGWRKKDSTYRLIQKLFIGPKIKVVKEVLKRKSPSKK